MTNVENERPVSDGPVAGTKLFDKLNKEIDCPYCQRTFFLREMEFLEYNGGNPFTAMFSDAQSTESDGNLMRRNKTSTSLSQRDGGSVQTADDNLAEEKPVEQRYGVFEADDVIAKRFLADYGEGVNLFRYNRKGTFYKIGTPEQAVEDPQYGYVSEEDPWDGDAPQLLHIVENGKPGGKHRIISSRLCPHCHCDLPSGYFACDPNRRFTIALAGGSASGKTQFITLVLNCLSDELGTLNLGMARLENYSKWFLQIILEQLSRKNSTDSTRREFQLLPFLISIKPRGQERCFVAFHDVPGEYTNADNNLAVNSDSFKQASLMLMMLDSSFLFRDVVDIEDPSQMCKTEPAEALQVFSQFQLCANCKKIIVVLTKIDTIFNADPPIIHADINGVKNGMILYENKLIVHKNAVNRTLLQDIDQEICGRILRNVKPTLREDLVEAFGKPVEISFLGVSTMIKGKDGEFELNPEATSGRHRLIEPLLQAFADLGILPEQENVSVEALAGGYPAWNDEPNGKTHWWQRKKKKRR